MDFLKQVGAWFVARLDEPSTWAGISAGALAIGQAVGSHAGLWGAIGAAFVAVVKAEAGSKPAA